MAHDVFISYSRKDSRVAEAIVESLRVKGVTCWIDKTLERMAGAKWSAEIAKAIEASRVMVLVYSRHVNSSQYIASEIHEAYTLSRPIVAFRLEDVPFDDGLRLALNRVQWFNAMPVTRRHVELLVGDVCRLLDVIAPPAPPLTWVDRARIFVWRMRDALTGRAGSRGLPSAPAPRAETAPGDTAPEAMARQGRWHALKRLMDERESRGIPLRQLAELQPVVAQRFERFERTRTRALAAIDHEGPERAGEYLARMREMVSDHPDLVEIEQNAVAMQRETGELRRTLDDYARTNRWTAAETAIRGLAHRRGLATKSLLRAAEAATSKSRHEMNRFELLVWLAAVGLAIVAVVCPVQAEFVGQSSGTDGSYAGVAAVIIRFLAVTVTTWVALAIFGRVPSSTNVGWTTVLSATAVLLVFVTSLIPRPLGDASLEGFGPLGAWLSSGTAGIVALCLLVVMQMATRDLLALRHRPPSIAAAAIALVAAGGLLDEPNVLKVDPRWCRYLPDAALASSILAVSGLITSRRAWLLLPIVATIMGTLAAPTTTHAGILFTLLLTGVFACGRSTLRGYACLAACVGVSYAAGQWCRQADLAAPLPPLGRLGPFVAIWGAAVAGVALCHKDHFAPARILDCLRKVVALRTVFAGTRLAQDRLTDTEWYRSGMAWHAAKSKGS